MTRAELGDLARKFERVLVANDQLPTPASLPHALYRIHTLRLALGEAAAAMFDADGDHDGVKRLESLRDGALVGGAPAERHDVAPTHAREWLAALLHEGMRDAADLPAEDRAFWLVGWLMSHSALSVERADPMVKELCKESKGGAP